MGIKLIKKIKIEDELLSALQSDLFRVSCKARGLAELLASYDRCAVPLDEDEVFEGIGMILRELGEELRSHSVDIDEYQVRKARRQQRSKKSDETSEESER